MHLMVQRQKGVIDYCKTTDMKCFPVQWCMQPTFLADISTNMLACVQKVHERQWNEICR